MNTQEEIIEMAKEVGLGFVVDRHWMCHAELEAFAKLVADKKEAEMQERIDQLFALYEMVCNQRNMLMDQQRAQVAAMRGQLQ
jgi:archaellum component FlaC